MEVGIAVGEQTPTLPIMYKNRALPTKGTHIFNYFCCENSFKTSVQGFGQMVVTTTGINTDKLFPNTVFKLFHVNHNKVFYQVVLRHLQTFNQNRIKI